MVKTSCFFFRFNFHDSCTADVEFSRLLLNSGWITVKVSQDCYCSLPELTVAQPTPENEEFEPEKALSGVKAFRLSGTPAFFCSSAKNVLRILTKQFAVIFRRNTYSEWYAFRQEGCRLTGCVLFASERSPDDKAFSKYFSVDSFHYEDCKVFCLLLTSKSIWQNFWTELTMSYIFKQLI